MVLAQLPEPGRSEYQAQFLQENPGIAGPVRSVLDLQLQYYALNQQFQDMMWKLEQQHYARCQSLFQDRQTIISGQNKDIALYSAVAAQRQGCGTSSSAPAPNGIPHFWLRAMKNNPTISRWIHSRDAPALSYLRDVRVEFMDENDVAGFRIVFDFDTNPYFSNKTLTKEFIYKRDPPQDDIYGELLYDRASGCDIRWNPGHDLTDIAMTSSGQFEYESFFDFFESSFYEDEDGDDSEGGSTSDGGEDGEGGSSDAVTDDEENTPYQRGRIRSREGSHYDDQWEDSNDGSVEEIRRRPADGSEDDSGDEGSDGDSDDEGHDSDDVVEQSALECDFELGEEIKDRLIPYAVHWYTGEARLFEDDDDSEDDDEGGGEDEDEDRT